ncbi:MAG: tetratricopeptide repeat protein [Desulfoarculaceae bacterium]|nr:tetratricopeptide repeat protein [Desulfoarculaceae bacterium]
MKKSLFTLIFLVSVSPFLIQCATQDEVRLLSYQLRAVNKKVEDLQANTVGEIQRKQASSSGQLSELQQEILELKSELEATAAVNRQFQQQNKALESSLQGIVSKQSSETDIKISQLNEQLRQQQDHVTTLQAARVQEAERRARAAAEAAEAARLKVKTTGSNQSIIHLQAEQQKVVKAQTPAPARVEASTPPVTLPAPPPPAEPDPSELSSEDPVAVTSSPAPKEDPLAPAAVASPADDLFNQAQQKYDAGNYQDAYELFESSIDKDGSGTKGVQARYMMGESLYQQKEYDQAILQYQKIISSQPKHAKTPAALLKQAMAFEQLSDKETAKIIYQKIISSYGSSPEAGQAKSKLSSL